MDLNKIGGRKFAFAVLITLMGFIFVLTNRVTADAFFAFAQIVGGIYVVGNVTSKLTEKID